MKCENKLCDNKAKYKCEDCEAVFCEDCAEGFDYDCPYHRNPGLYEIEED